MISESVSFADHLPKGLVTQSSKWYRRAESKPVMQSEPMVSINNENRTLRSHCITSPNSIR